VDNASTLISCIAALIAWIAAAIACGQWRLAENRFKLDLFEKRYKLFEAIRKFLAVILQEGEFKNSDLFEFYAGTSDALFLFNDDIVSYIDSIRDHAIKMRHFKKSYEDLPAGDERTRNVELEGKEFRWLIEELRNLQKKFHPYLGFSHLK